MFTSSNFNLDISKWNVRAVTDIYSIFENAKKFNQDLTIWQAFNNSLDESVFLRSASLIKYCENLTPSYIDSYISKKELELREKLTKTERLGLKKDVDDVKKYRLLSDFKELKDRLEAVDIKTVNKEI
jgi:surface protein